MKKVLIGVVTLLMSFASYAQTEENTSETVEQPKYWSSNGNFTLIANQSSFSNWQAGGDNSFAGNVNINYSLNYKKADWSWDNQALVNYGLTKLKGDETKKTADRLEINSTLGKKASELWYYSMFLNFKTQMDTGIDKDGVRTSHFMSPAYLQVGPGMLWKKSDNLKVNIAPATSRFIFVDDHFTALGSSFGVDQGKSMKYQLGMSVNAYYKVNVMENVSVENILNLYSNYLEKPQNIVMDYQLNVVLKVNKYLTTNVTFQTIYDDLAFQGFQVREMVGLGVNYSF